MSTFICEKCGCIDNTSCGGTFWAVGLSKGKNKEKYFKDNILKKTTHRR